MAMWFLRYKLHTFTIIDTIIAATVHVGNTKIILAPDHLPLRDNVCGQWGIGICMVCGECIIIFVRGEPVIRHWMCEQLLR